MSKDDSDFSDDGDIPGPSANVYNPAALINRRDAVRIAIHLERARALISRPVPGDQDAIAETCKYLAGLQIMVARDITSAKFAEKSEHLLALAEKLTSLRRKLVMDEMDEIRGVLGYSVSEAA